MKKDLPLENVVDVETSWRNRHKKIGGQESEGACVADANKARFKQYHVFLDKIAAF